MRSAKLFASTLIANLCFACSPDNSGQLEHELVQSVKVGEEASTAKPAYGLPLYPDAQVHTSLMDGMTLGITVEASRGELAKFYSDALMARGYVIESEVIKQGRLTITANDPSDRSSKMTVSISPNDDDSSKYTLIFVKLKTPPA